MDKEHEEKIEEFKHKNMQKELPNIHYHGDILRSIYLVMAVIIVVITPFFQERLPLSAFYSVLGVLVLSLLAGLTNPKIRLIIIFDFVVAVLALLSFGYESILSYNETSLDNFFLFNLLLALLSVFALYFSSKTLRGHLLS